MAPSIGRSFSLVRGVSQVFKFCKFSAQGFQFFRVPLQHREYCATQPRSLLAAPLTTPRHVAFLVDLLTHCIRGLRYTGAECRCPEALDMNKNVAEAARRLFGNLPHSKGRSGNKALRKNIIGRKIAEVSYKLPRQW